MERQDFNVFSPTKLIAITLVIIFLIHFSVCLDGTTPGYQVIYSEVLWVSRFVCMLAAVFVTVIKGYKWRYILEVYIALWGYRLMAYIPFQSGNFGRLANALALGTVVSLLFSWITELLIVFMEGDND